MNCPQLEINISQPKVKVLELEQAQMPSKYRECLLINPLLGRIEITAKGAGWSELAIVQYQLLVACQSNASLQERLKAIGG